MKTKLKAFYFVEFLSFGILGPYLALYLSEKGFTGTQIGLLLGMVPLLTVLFQPVWSYLSDTLNKRRLLLIIACGGVSISMMGLGLADTFITTFMVFFLFAVFITPITSISTAIVLEYLDKNGIPDEFGLIRVWGSIAYAVSSLLLAMIFLDKIVIFFPWIMAGLYLLLALLSFSLPISKVTFSQPKLNDLKVLTRNPILLTFLLGGIFIGGTLNIAINYQTLFLQSLDASDVLIGIVTSSPALLEVPMMAVVPVLLKRISLRWLILAGAVILPIRWLLYLFVQRPQWIFAVILLNGISTISFEVAGVSFINKIVDQKWRVTGQGLYSTVMYGIGPAIGLYLAGNVLERVNIRAVWGLNIIMGLIGCAIIFIALWRFNPSSTEKTNPS